MAAKVTKEKKAGQRARRMEPEVTTREGKIAMLVAAGMGGEAIWAAMEQEYPELIEDDKARFKASGDKALAYDADARKRAGWAINSTRGLEIKDDERVREIMEMSGIQMQDADDIELKNRKRFRWGIPALDFIYGQTNYIHLSDAANSKYENVKTPYLDPTSDKMVEREVKTWVKGDWRMGDPMIPDGKGSFEKTRASDGTMLELDLSRQLVEHGSPEAFMSVWPGSPGVGKTRLAIAAGKAVNKETRRPILYCNGEADPQDFRGWLGADVDGSLFKVMSGELVRTEDICAKAYEVKPAVIFIDSIQMVAEVEKGNRGMKAAMARFKLLKNDERAGRPHIVFISQLNKKNELMGSRYLEHIVDFVAKVYQVEGRKGVFIFECPRKNRGGPTPRGAMFKHDGTTVSCIATDLRQGPQYKLVQPVSQPLPEAIEQGVVDPIVSPGAATGHGDGDEQDGDAAEAEVAAIEGDMD